MNWYGLKAEGQKRRSYGSIESCKRYYQKHLVGVNAVITTKIDGIHKPLLKNGGSGWISHEKRGK